MAWPAIGRRAPGTAAALSGARALRAAMALVAAAALTVVGPLNAGGPRTTDAAVDAAAEMPIVAQEATASGAPRAAVRLSADTVRVGEPFTVGVVASGPGSVRFPPLLEPADGWEQLEVARIEEGDGNEVRAYYRLVAWEAGRLALPEVTATTTADGRTAGEFRLELPAPFVASVLPADAENVRLRGPRPPLESGFPWLLLLAGLLLAALLAWWLWRRRSGDGAVEEIDADVRDPAEETRAALVALRAQVEAGELGAAAFYDRLEQILREYLAGTREWSSALPVRAAAWTGRGAMRDLHRHAVMSRFAGVEAPGPRLLGDVDVSLEWLSKDAA